MEFYSSLIVLERLHDKEIGERVHYTHHVFVPSCIVYSIAYQKPPRGGYRFLLSTKLPALLHVRKKEMLHYLIGLEAHAYIRYCFLQELNLLRP